MLNKNIILADSPHTGLKVIADFDSTYEMGRAWCLKAGFSISAFNKLIDKWAQAINNYYSGVERWQHRIDHAYNDVQMFITFGR